MSTVHIHEAPSAELAQAGREAQAALAVARERWPMAASVSEAWWHDPDQGVIGYHVTDRQDAWLGNVERLGPEALWTTDAPMPEAEDF